MSLVLGVLMVCGLIYVDALIQQKFEGKRWAVPAKVYARPLELYEGADLTQEQLVSELQRLGYRKTQKPGKLAAGHYRVNGSQVAFHSRGFAFWDGRESSREVLVSMADNQIRSLQADDLTHEIVRLEPLQIGGIYPAHNEDRVLVSIHQVPQLLVSALLAVEDRDFYQHWGISLRGIARAVLTNLKAGGLRQGGSTLTQQLVKNFYLTNERSLSRKLLEAVMSVLLDFHYEKDDILEAYINEIYLGQSGKRAIHGFGLASLYYFGQPLRELEPHQIALLVGIVKGASWYDPRRNPERALKRRNQVLDIMVEQGVLDADKAERYKRKSLDVIARPVYEDERYPAFMDLVKRQLKQDYRDEDLRTEGLRIFTTLDPFVQEGVERAFAGHFELLQQRHGQKMKKLQGAAVITQSHTGEVLAVYGDRRVRYKGFNRALDAYRPVGSLMKPVVYLAALDNGYGLATMIDDGPISVPLDDGSVWQPHNFDHKSHGIVPLQVALAQSYNQAAARVAMDIGVDAVVAQLEQLGFERSAPRVPAIALGAVDMSPFEVAMVYQTIAGAGFYTPLRAIRSVMDATGQPVQRYGMEVERRVDPERVYLITAALQEVVHHGTARRAYRYLPDTLNLAGKTGTSDDQRDAWFAGWSGNYLGVFWVGEDHNESTPLTGASGALPVWIDTMKKLPLKPVNIPKPASIEWLWINPQEWTLSKAHCDGAVYLPLRHSHRPTRHSPCGESGHLFDWIKSWFGD